ncbi:MAG: YbaN family protein [Xanthomonadales bacterium]|nr:YbaN family protein [Xanthomonadales bacterium]
MMKSMEYNPEPRQDALTRVRKDFSAQVRKHPLPAVRAALLLAGTGSIIVGLAGVLLPVLPTTPFLLVAAACYARASRRFYNALLNNRLCGPAIVEWQQHRSIHHRTKLLAVTLMAVTLTTSIVFFVADGRLRMLLALLGLVLAGLLIRIPTRDRS